jgi:hypothetical protein
LKWYFSQSAFQICTRKKSLEYAEIEIKKVRINLKWYFSQSAFQICTRKKSLEYAEKLLTKKLLPKGCINAVSEKTSTTVKSRTLCVRFESYKNKKKVKE